MSVMKYLKIYDGKSKILSYYVPAMIIQFNVLVENTT